MKRITALFLISFLMLGLCGCALFTKSSRNEIDSSLDYNGLFDTSIVHEIDVDISEDDWADLKANPLQKTKYRVSVTIDGTLVEAVSFAAKGNSSLSQVASSDSDRYSFKINFGKFVKGRTYYGLDKLNLNNIMSDATYMKDYLSYTIMREAGVYAPLISYAKLSINGEYFGLYAIIENVSDSFLERNFGNDDGALYKPETSQLDMGDMPAQGDVPNASDMPGGFPFSSDMPAPSGAPGQGGGFDPSSGGQGGQGGGFDPSSGGQGGGFDPSSGGQGGQGGFGPGMFRGGDNAGADLVYKDDDPASYSAVFDNEENEVGEEDELKLIAAIKALSDGENLDKYWDMDQVIRYFAAHNFVLNYDSYTGTMLHNYYLYEQDGKVTVFPWDYNLAFGGFMGAGDATSAVNTPIDSPLSGTTEESRPLWKAIVSNEEYLALYHRYYSELIEGFFKSGRCVDEIERIEKLIAPYVKSDPTAFYSFEQFETAVETLKAFCSLRAESIEKQLSGKLGSTDSTQNSSDLVDASGLDMSSMGTQGGGQGGPGGQTPPDQSGGQGKPGGGDMSGRPQFPGGTSDPSGTPQFPGGMPDPSGSPQGPQPPAGGNG